MRKKVNNATGEEIARAVVALVEMPGAPDFLIDGMMSLLYALEDVTGAKLRGRDAESGWNLVTLANVIEAHPTLHLKLEREKDLAELISAVLNHPDLPVSLYNGFRDTAHGLINNEAMDSPEVIRALLKVNPDQTKLREAESRKEEQ